mgnify:CR=1 FL=1
MGPVFAYPIRLDQDQQGKYTLKLGMTVTDLIEQAQGLTEQASSNSERERGPKNASQKRSLPLPEAGNQLLENGDIIRILEKSPKSAQTWVSTWKGTTQPETIRLPDGRILDKNEISVRIKTIRERIRTYQMLNERGFRNSTRQECPDYGELRNPGSNHRQCLSEPLDEVRAIFQTCGHADQMARDTAALCPVELIVVCQQGVGADEGEIGAEAGAFAHAQSIVKARTGAGSILEQEGQEAAIAAIGTPDVFVAGTSLPFGMPHRFYLGMSLQKLCQSQCIAAHDIHSV